MSFKDKTAIISGAASGIGLLCAQKLAEEGANVVLTDINLEAVTSAAEEISGSAVPVQVDVTDYSQIEAAVNLGIEKFGKIDILINCAGGAPHNVRACCVAPGPVLTRPAMSKMWTPLGRAAETIEVVDFILYLCSDKAEFITGSYHLIDGGRACGAR